MREEIKQLADAVEQVRAVDGICSTKELQAICHVACVGVTITLAADDQIGDKEITGKYGALAGMPIRKVKQGHQLILRMDRGQRDAITVRTPKVYDEWVARDSVVVTVDALSKMLEAIRYLVIDRELLVKRGTEIITAEALA